LEDVFLRPGWLKFLISLSKNTDALVAAGVVGILVVMIIPISQGFLDLFLTLSIALALVILLLSVYVKESLEFSVFPTVLLIATLFRLSINVASTRLILMNGHDGGAAAGRIIQSFGDFVVGGNYVVGLIVFIILVVINFMVITKGAGRVAEVAARFTLDAMPGKQMAIDADLNAGIITEKEARKRRSDIALEADFYGSMDGASKFVRGDAIAGIIITGINIIGGLIIGVMQKGLDIATAAENYTLLTVGDGLVSQIPALIISTAAGIIVTRTASGENLGDTVSAQLFSKPKVMYVVSGILLLIGLTPGLPFFPFFFFSVFLVGVAYISKYNQKIVEEEKMLESKKQEAKQTDTIESMLSLDILELEVGYGLISVVDANKQGDLVDRITAIRKQFASDLGIVVPMIHIRDNLSLESGDYRFLIKGIEIAKGNLLPEHLLAMDPGDVLEEIEGVKTLEPAFNLPALWINQALKEKAQLNGYTVVDLSTVLATHITELIKKHAHELLNRQDLQSLIEMIAKTHPKLIDELIPNLLNLGSILKVLHNLLKEGVSIRDLHTILETLADYAPISKETDQLTEHVRAALSRSITTKYLNEQKELPIIILERNIEEMLANSIVNDDFGTRISLAPNLLRKLLDAMSKTIEEVSMYQDYPIVLCSPPVRLYFKRLIERFLPSLIVLSHNEIVPQTQIKQIGMVRIENAN